MEQSLYQKEPETSVSAQLPQEQAVILSPSPNPSIPHEDPPTPVEKPQEDRPLQPLPEVRVYPSQGEAMEALLKGSERYIRYTNSSGYQVSLLRITQEGTGKALCRVMIDYGDETVATALCDTRTIYTMIYSLEVNTVILHKKEDVLVEMQQSLNSSDWKFLALHEELKKAPLAEDAASAVKHLDKANQRIVKFKLDDDSLAYIIRGTHPDLGKAYFAMLDDGEEHIAAFSIKEESIARFIFTLVAQRDENRIPRAWALEEAFNTLSHSHLE